MYLLRLTALKLWYDVDKCYDLVFPLDLEKLSHAVQMKSVQFLQAWRRNFHFPNMITMPHICDNVPMTHQ